MVEAGATVTALEPSAGMVEILKEKMAEKGIGSDRICIDQRAWQDVDVEKEGLSGQFDLVFASMSPGVNDPETLDKAMRASRKFLLPEHLFRWRHAGRPTITSGRMLPAGN